MSRIKRAAFAIAELRLLPLACFIVLPVILVRLAIVPIASDATGLWPEYWVGDTRSWWKAVMVVGIAAWMLLFIVARLLTGWLPRHRGFGCLVVVAAVSILVSALLSPFRNTVWIGYTTLHEGALVLWAYLIGAWYAAEMTDQEGALTGLLRLIGVVCLVEACHGIAEGFGWNLWQTGFGRWLMGAGVYEVQYRFAESRMAYGTAFQPNHYGMLLAMLGMLVLGMVARERKQRWKFFWFATYLTTVAAIFFSNSRAGFLVLLLLTVLHCVAKIVSGRAIDSRGIWAGQSFLAIVLLAAIVAAMLPVTRDAAVRLIRRLGEMDAPVDTFTARSMELKDDKLRIEVSDGTLVLEKNSRDGWIYGIEGGVTAEAQADDFNWHAVSISDAHGVSLRFRRAGNAMLTIGSMTIEMYAVGKKIWFFDREAGLLRSEVSPFAFTPGTMDGFLSKRWYIWRRSLEAIVTAPWFGGGPGAFALVYPNSDFLNNRRMGFDEHEDKGHGVWATSLAQLGIVGTVACGLCALYALLGLLRQRGAFSNPIFLALAGYGVCSLTNDSTVGVTPIFCALVGCAVSSGGTGA